MAQGSDGKAMCFSASASFLAAGLTGAVGLAAILRTEHPRDLPAAAVPLVFAVQQTIEGLIWLGQDSGAGPAPSLVLSYLLLAQIFWPLYAPFAVWVAEPEAARRRLMLLALALGAVVSAYLAWGLGLRPPRAVVIGGHIVYRSAHGDPLVIGLPYLTATCLPLLASSRRTLVALGVVVVAGALVSYLFYWRAFLSVWCFFAAAASIVLLAHLEQLRRSPAARA